MYVYVDIDMNIICMTMYTYIYIYTYKVSLGMWYDPTFIYIYGQLIEKQKKKRKMIINPGMEWGAPSLPTSPCLPE